MINIDCWRQMRRNQLCMNFGRAVPLLFYKIIRSCLSLAFIIYSEINQFNKLYQFFINFPQKSTEKYLSLSFLSFILYSPSSPKRLPFSQVKQLNLQIENQQTLRFISTLNQFKAFLFGGLISLQQKGLWVSTSLHLLLDRRPYSHECRSMKAASMMVETSMLAIRLMHVHYPA